MRLILSFAFVLILSGIKAQMTFSSSTVTQGTCSAIQNDFNKRIIGIQIVTAGSGAVLNATQFNLNTNGTTAVSDLRAAKVFYTGTSSVFSDDVPFGSVFLNPNGAFTISGNMALQFGTNYFWVAYDIAPNAVLGHVIDAECTQITISSSSYTPSTTAPAGNETISNSGVFIVTNTNDSGTGSMRSAIASANAFGCDAVVDARRISGTINCNSTMNLSGTNKITIIGPGADKLTINGSGNGSFGMYHLGSAGPLTVKGITFANHANRAFYTPCTGLTILDGCAFISNQGTSALYSPAGTLIIKNTTFDNNKHNTSFAGALYTPSCNAKLSNCTFSNNWAYQGGGAIYHPSAGYILTVENCTFTGNYANNQASTYGGGAIDNFGTVNIVNSIFSGNSANGGTGFDLKGSFNMDYSLLGNTGGATITGANNILGTAANLGAVGNNGGTTPTAALIAGSAGIDVGTNASGPQLDQRGFCRVNTKDMGSYEYNGPAVPALSVAITPLTPTTICQGDSAKFTIASAVGGGPSPQYFWYINKNYSGTGINFATTALANNDYVSCLMISNATAGCNFDPAVYSQAISFTVNARPLVTATSATVCVGQVASLTASGAGGSGTYLWNTTANTAAINITATSSASYSVVGTDVNGCKDTAYANLTANPLPAVTVNSPSYCIGDSATLNAGGALTYLWSTTATTSSIMVNATASNSYTVTGTDANSCSNTAVSAVTVNLLPAITVNSPTICANQTVVLTASGGATYLWSTTQTTSSISFSPGGSASYTVTGTDANGCSDSDVATVTVNSLPTVTVTSDTICFGQTALLSASGALTYSWSSGTAPSAGTPVSASPASTSSYTVTGTDANNCSNTAVATVKVNQLPVVNIAAPLVICANTPATITATGASTYSWNTAATTAAITVNLTTSTGYTVTGTDVSGCVNTATIMLTPVTVVLNTGASNASCYGSTNGNIISAVSGGTSPYAYSWSNGSSAQNISGIPAGTYTLTVTDAKGCIVSITTAVTQPSQIVISVTTTNASCGQSDGSALASVSGGTGPYIYQWSNGDNQSLSDSLHAGQYFLQVYDNIGCHSSAVVSVNNTNGPSISLTGNTFVSCNGGNNGALSITTSGGLAPYTYAWSNGITTAANTGLQAGPYDITVTDANNCTTSQTYTVTQPAALSAVFNVNPATCGAGDGSASVTVSGGTPGYIYLWSANTGNQVTDTAFSLSSGLYSVSIMDAMGCSITKVGTVSSANSDLAIAVDTVVQGGCSSLSSGEIYITVTGGLLPYTFAWNNGASTEDVNGLSPGDYVVLVTDSNSCSVSRNVHVSSSMEGYQPEICLVTVDTATFTNLVVWEKTLTAGISAFKVYRETSSPGVYQAIGSSPYDSLSQYTDPVANPQVHSWRYKITSVDSCGTETPMSQPHKTIHLTQNLGFSGSINLAWDYYDGFSYSTYYIWRHDPSTNWVLLDSLPVTLTSYTDLTPPS
ncbi:MAG: beta strand repeat-containing protein, partial [Bacteroidia bacterium]